MALSGTVPSAKVTSSITRANIAADAFSSLRQEGNEGKTLTLTVRGNCASAKKSAILAFPLPLEMKLSDVYATAFGENVSISFTAENLKGSLGYAKTATGSTAVAYIKVGSAAEVAKTLAFDTEDPTSYMNNLEIARNPGDTVTITFKSDPAKAADYKQTPATATVIAQGEAVILPQALSGFLPQALTRTQIARGGAGGVGVMSWSWRAELEKKIGVGCRCRCTVELGVIIVDAASCRV